MSRRAWITGDTLPVDNFICRRLRIPNDDIFLANVNGALWSLCEEWNWEQVGTLTIEEATNAAKVMYEEYKQGEACLIGAILPYATTNAPSGTLPCDGSTHLRADYPMLYAALDPVYIIDADTFKTPDLQGRTVIGNGTLETIDYSIGDEGGEQTHVLTVAELAEHSHIADSHSHTSPPHTHTYDHPIVNIDVEGAGVPDPVAVGQPFFPATTSATSVGIDGTTVTLQNSGENEAHNNLQPFHVLRYCIVSR